MVENRAVKTYLDRVQTLLAVPRFTSFRNAFIKDKYELSRAVYWDHRSFRQGARRDAILKIDPTNGIRFCDKLNDTWRRDPPSRRAGMIYVPAMI